MDKSSIGINAGRVWQKLSESNKRWEYEELKHALGLADRDLNAAIGWLAREDKIQFYEDKIQFYEDKAGHKDYLYLEINYYIG